VNNLLLLSANLIVNKCEQPTLPNRIARSSNWKMRKEQLWSNMSSPGFLIASLPKRTDILKTYCQRYSELLSTAKPTTHDSIHELSRKVAFACLPSCLDSMPRPMTRFQLSQRAENHVDNVCREKIWTAVEKTYVAARSPRPSPTHTGAKRGASKVLGTWPFDAEFMPHWPGTNVRPSHAVLQTQ